MSSAPREGWIVSCDDPSRDVAGMPQLLRTACALKAAGVKRIVVVGGGRREEIANDPRLEGATIEWAETAPAGDEDDPILVARGDRVFHRDGPKVLAQAAGTVRAVAGWEALLVAPRGKTRAGFAARAEAVEAAEPHRGFDVPLGDARAETLLISSLRKPIDGLASRAMNRGVSLWLTRRLMRTPIRPDHVTLLTMLCGVAAGAVCALGGYFPALAGVLLLELGSIIDGVDGELARLKYMSSRRGEWLDTISDDLANACFMAGAAANLSRAGVAWAWPIGGVALATFICTQVVSYVRIAKRGSGDLAVLTWRIADGGLLGFLALCVKRDFFVTLFVPLVALGRLDVVLALLALGALGVAIGMLVDARLASVTS